MSTSFWLSKQLMGMAAAKSNSQVGWLGPRVGAEQYIRQMNRAKSHNGCAMMTAPYSMIIITSTILIIIISPSFVGSGNCSLMTRCITTAEPGVNCKAVKINKHRQILTQCFSAV